MLDEKTKEVKKNYTVTVTMISYNDGSILEECLTSIRNQNYDQKLVNILMVDGGSTDDTLKIAQKYGVGVVSRPDLKDQPNVRAGMAFTLPQTDLILIFSADNRFQEQDTLAKMIETFVSGDVVACETLRYGYRATDPILTRYFALIGGNDPIAVGLGKADRGPYDNKKTRHSFGKAQDCGEYYKVKFKADITKIPTIGANGFLVRRDIMEKADYKENAAHIDMCVSLIQRGYNIFAFVKDRHIVHYFSIAPMQFIKRRLLYADIYSGKKIKRGYSVFHKKDGIKLALLILANGTFLIPLLRALRGYTYVKDVAWFLHPVMCFAFTASYSCFYLKKILKYRA